jgi:hypothetical protein
MITLLTKEAYEYKTYPASWLLSSKVMKDKPPDENKGDIYISGTQTGRTR